MSTKKATKGKKKEVAEQPVDRFGEAMIHREADAADHRAIKAEAQLSSMLVLTKSIRRERDEAIKINRTLVAEKGDLLKQLAEARSQSDLEKGTLAVENKLLHAELQRMQHQHREVKALLHGLYDKIEGRNSSGA